MRWTLALLLCACDLRGERPSSQPSSPSSPDFDCGLFTPYSSLHCSAAVPPDVVDSAAVVLPRDELLQRTHAAPCVLGKPACEGAFSLRAGHSALCEVTSPRVGALRIEASFGAEAACVPGLAPHVSGVGVAPRWQGRLLLPGAGERYRISAEASTTEGERCSLTVGTAKADPIRRGTAPVLLTFVDGPASLDVVLDCSGSLAGHACGNLDPCEVRPDDVQQQSSISLILEVASCPDAC